MADNDALDAALALFNDGIQTQQAEEAAQRAVEKAERKKQQAATELKKLQSDPNASAEDKAAANEAYRGAVDSFNKSRSGEVVEDADQGEGEAGDMEGAADAAEDGGEAPSSDPTPEEPAAEEPAAD